MRSTENVLRVHRDRGKKGQTLERVYRHLYNPELYLKAYAKISQNQGALTKGVTQETVDGMSLDRIMRIIDLIKHERYRWTPVRRVEIPKPKGGKRPLSIPTWSDKLVQEAMRILLEAYYEPKFSNASHGFRPKQGCHTALMDIKKRWNGVVWFIEGDISKCFDTIDHDILLGIIRRDVKDERFIRLLKGAIKAGYLQDWKLSRSLSGTPQGGIISPLLANICLNELDSFVESSLIPNYTKGRERARSTTYRKYDYAIERARKTGNWQLAQELVAERARKGIKRGIADDPDYRRLRYVRYADDFLLGFIGPKSEAKVIKGRIRDFLEKELNLKLSPEKTLLTNATTDKARFLGYEITKLVRTSGKRLGDGTMSLLVPTSALDSVRARYTQRGKAIHRVDWLKFSDYTIIQNYQSVLRGIYEYFALGVNVTRRMRRIKQTLEISLTKTLAAKYKCSVREVYRRYGGRNEDGYVVLSATSLGCSGELTATFGGIPFKHKKLTEYSVDFDINLAENLHTDRRSERVDRMLSYSCEVCGAIGPVQMHHIRKLADLKNKNPWEVQMSAMRRKTLAVCASCHQEIHAGRYDGPRLSSLPESRVQ